MNDIPWWQTAFNSQYQAIYAHRDDASAAEEIAGLIPRLQSVSGPVLDLGCGNGRHLTALRQAHIRAFGCDYSRDLLMSAQQRDQCRGLVFRGDMRLPPVAGGWGAIVMLFTAFGYFTESENATCLQRIGTLLAKDGWLIIDLPDPFHVEQTLVPFSTRTLKNGHTLEERRRIKNGRVEKQVIITNGSHVEHDYTESVALYSKEQFTALAHKQGLIVADLWPSLQGPKHDTQRMVYWLQRP